MRGKPPAVPLSTTVPQTAPRLWVFVSISVGIAMLGVCLGFLFDIFYLLFTRPPSERQLSFWDGTWTDYEVRTVAFYGSAVFIGLLMLFTKWRGIKVRAYLPKSNVPSNLGLCGVVLTFISVRPVVAGYSFLWAFLAVAITSVGFLFAWSDEANIASKDFEASANEAHVRTLENRIKDLEAEVVEYQKAVKLPRPQRLHKGSNIQHGGKRSGKSGH